MTENKSPWRGGCINCGFKTTDRDELRVHSCRVSSWKEALEIRLAEKETEAEKRCNAAEDAIAAIVGRTLDSSTFWQLRHLFQEWEDAEEARSLAIERMNDL